jgi:transposase
MGPKRLTPELQAEICTLIKIGMGKREAARALGVNRRLIQAWIEKGKEEESGPYRDFYEATETAYAQMEQRDLQTIDAAASEGRYGASQWRLERLRPEKYAQRLEDRYKKRILRELNEHLRDTLDPEVYEAVYASLASFDDEARAASADGDSED